MRIRDQQMALPLEPDGLAGDILPDASNEAARSWLANTAEWPGARLAVWGPTGSGKSSLARLWAGPDGSVISGPNLRELSVPAGRLAIDDADCSTDNAGLLHLLNMAAETGCHVLLTGRSAPAHWGVELPDLSSRLKAIQAVEITPPGDALLELCLAHAIAERQLQVPPPVQEWLLRRLPRTIPAMREAAARLDGLSLARQQPITRPLAATALCDMLGDTDENTVTVDAG